MGPSVTACLKLMNSDNLLNLAVGKGRAAKGRRLAAKGQQNYREFKLRVVFYYVADARPAHFDCTGLHKSFS